MQLASAIALTAVLGAGLALGAAVEVARAKATAGEVTVQTDGKVLPVNASTQFKDGDVVTVAAGARLTMEFADGSWLALVGPAQLTVVRLTEEGRWVQLESGVISQASAGEVALGIQVQAGDGLVGLVLQNATGFARVVPGETVVFEKLTGDTAQVFSDGKLTDLDLRHAWRLNLRGAVTMGDGTAGLGAPGSSAGEVARFALGHVPIAYAPEADFRPDVRDDGGVRLTYVGDDFGRVDVGGNTSLFLGPGEFVEFDADGNIVNFTGVSHIYHPTDMASFYDNPVEDVADASYSKPRNR